MIRILHKSLQQFRLQNVEKIRLDQQRCYVAAPKRFYKNTSILFNDGQYEITLDHRKLKTPSGKTLQVASEPLAIAIATEWDSQKEKINRSNMHLTSLCNTCIDNPNKLQKEDMMGHILNILPTDTILFQSSEDDDLYRLQQKEWDPIIDWFNKRFETNVVKTRTISPPTISGDTKMKISKHILSYDFTAVHGILYAVDCLKSVILGCACIEKFITVEKAVHLCRLEEEFQSGFWGRVDWWHDLNQQDIQARVAAAVLFTYFNSTNSLVKEKILR